MYAWFDACLECGGRGQVTSVLLEQYRDDSRVRLHLAGTFTDERLRAVPERLANADLSALSMLVVKHRLGTVAVKGPSRMTRAAPRRSGLTFEVRSRGPIPSRYELWERCLRLLRVRMRDGAHARWRPGDGYGPHHIEVLTFPQCVRLRPGMYVGPTATWAPVVAMAVRAALRDGATRIAVSLEGSTCALRGDGPALSFGVASGKLPMEPVPEAWSHLGEGLELVIPLCERVSVQSTRGGATRTLEFADGSRTGALPEVPSNGDEPGNHITIKPDAVFFDAPATEADVRAQLEELVRVAPTLDLSLNGQRLASRWPDAALEHALSSWSSELGGDVTRELWNNAVFSFVDQTSELRVCCALGWLPTLAPRMHVLTFRNQVLVPRWMSLLRGLERAIEEAVQLQPAETPRGWLAGLVGVVCVRCADKHKADDDEQIERQVHRALANPLSVFLDALPDGRETLTALPPVRAFAAP